MRIPKGIVFLMVFAVLLPLTMSFQTAADQDGKGDGDFACTGCHKDGGGASVNLTTSPDTIAGGQNSDIVVTVNADAINDDNYLVGVMLLTGSGDNVEDDGWTISVDPNGNAAPFNYNEMTGVSGDTDFTWTLVSPTEAGTYTLKTRIIFGGDEANYLDSAVETITITESASGETDSVDEGVSIEALTFGLLAGAMGLVAVVILRRRW